MRQPPPRTARFLRRCVDLAVLLAAADPTRPPPVRALLARRPTTADPPEPGEAAISPRRAAL